MRVVFQLDSSKHRRDTNTEMCSGSEAGSHLRLIDSFITQLKAQGPSRTCNESKEEEILHDVGFAADELFKHGAKSLAHMRKGSTSFGACEVRCWRWLFGRNIPLSGLGLSSRGGEMERGV